MKKLAIAALLVGLSFFIFSEDLKLNLSTQKTLGYIEKIQGEVIGKSETAQFFSPLKTKSPLTSNHKIMTSFDSQAFISFGESFILKSNTLVRIEFINKNYKIHLLSGTIKRKALGSAQFFIDGKQLKTLELTKGGAVELTQIPIDEVSLNVETPNRTPEALNKRQIYQTFKLHQRFIEKCFIKHYTRLEGQTESGKVWVAFDILKNGHLDSIKIEKSDYSDSEFHSCLKEVVSRVRMKNDKGPKMKIKFPISIDLPE